MNTSRVLLGTRDPEKCRDLRTLLEFEGHQVSYAVASLEILDSISSSQYDVLILDQVFESAGVFALCRDVRSKSGLGIIILSCDDSAQVRIDALNAGADDFLPPGFALAELMARVRAILRRVTPASGNREHVVLPDRAIDFQSHEISGPGGRIAHLTPKECSVLRHLVGHANKPLTPQSLAQNVWQRDGLGQIEFVRVVVKQLRRKLEPDPNHPRYILTQRSAGYQFHMPV
jgi:two-component system, OmpR family, KDP operon response regulator KdpE